jgi:F-type H+-transporting ATPase subunit b
MNLNATLLGQMVTFLLFIWITMKFIWPPVIRALQDRQKRIAEGLDAAERGQHSLELSKHEAVKILHDAKIEASNVIDQTNLRASKIIEEAKTQGRQESHRLVLQGQAEIDQNVEQAKVDLRQYVAELAVAGASQIMSTEIDQTKHENMLNALIKQIEESHG